MSQRHQYISVSHTMLMQGWVYYDNEKKCLRYMIDEIPLLRIDNRRGRPFCQGSNQIRSVLLLLMQFISILYG